MARIRSAKEMEHLLIAGMKEALAITRGESKPVRSRTRTARDTRVAPPPDFDAKRVVAVREALEVSQPIFAKVLNVSPALVRGWERGARTPSGAAARLLQLAERGDVRLASVGAAKHSRAASLSQTHCTDKLLVVAQRDRTAAKKKR